MKKESSALPDFVQKILDIITPFIQGYMMSYLFYLFFIAFLIYFILPGSIAIDVLQLWQNEKTSGIIGLWFFLALPSFFLNYIWLIWLINFLQKKHSKKEIIRLFIAIFWFIYPLFSVILNYALHGIDGFLAELYSMLESGFFMLYPTALPHLILFPIFLWINHPQVVFFSFLGGMLLFVATYYLAVKSCIRARKKVRK